MKKILIALGVLVGLVVLAVGGLFAVMFGGLQPLVDGKEWPGGVRTIKDGIVAAFILPTGDHAVALVDCGNDDKGTAILAELRRRGLGPEAVKAIFLTHGHADHTAGCHLFDQAEVYAFSSDVALAAGTARSKGPLPKHFDTPAEKRARVTKTLSDATPVTVGDLVVVPYLIPGHTAGSAAYLADGVLFMGDSMGITKDGDVRPAPWLASDSTEQNHASLRHLADALRAANAQVVAVAPAHSGPGMLDALERYRP